MCINHNTACKKLCYDLCTFFVQILNVKFGYVRILSLNLYYALRRAYEAGE